MSRSSCWFELRLPRRQAQTLARRGFTLLEVILALSILAGGVAVIGEVMRLANRNSHAARSLAEAQMLCESKLNELCTGAEVMGLVNDVPFPDPFDQWSYTIELVPLDVPDLAAVRVTVSEIVPDGRLPLSFSLTRWTHDPGAELASMEAENAAKANQAAEAANTANSDTGTGTGDGTTK